MDSNNPKTLAPIPSQCTPYSYYCRPSEVFPNIPDRPELQKRDRFNPARRRVETKLELV